jgi:hypothetical protein
MASRKVGLLGIVLAAAACASGPRQEHDCDVNPAARPLGRKIFPFIAWVRSRPDATREEISTRSSMLVADGGRLLSGRGDEVDRISADGRRFWFGFPDRFSERGSQMVDALSLKGDRISEDAHCFLARAWNALKLAE